MYLKYLLINILIPYKMRTIKFISDIVEEKVLITKLKKLEYEKQIYKLHMYK